MSASKLLMPAMVHHPACPKPDAFNVCKCGANVACRSCGWGGGAMPCKCSRERAAGERGQ